LSPEEAILAPLQADAYPSANYESDASAGARLGAEEFAFPELPHFPDVGVGKLAVPALDAPVPDASLIPLEQSARLV
jgi:hypothetical protein